jgi:hypothetical protein
MENELAEMMEQEAERADAEADLPLFAWEKLPPEAWPREEAMAAIGLNHRLRHRIRRRVYAAEDQDFRAGADAARLEEEAIARGLARRESAWPRWREHLSLLPVLLAVTAGCVVIGLFVRWWIWGEPLQRPGFAQAESRDGGVGDVPGASGISEDALTTYLVKAELPQKDGGVALGLPEQPLPGQRRPDSSGRCRRHREIAINGGCWRRPDGGAPPCEVNEYEWQGSCYVPAWESPQEPASNPP